MSATSRSAMFFLCILCLSTTLVAQDDTRVALQQKSLPVITAAAAEGKFRFSSPAGAAQIRVQIASASGETLFDSAWKDGNVFDWPMETPGQPLANGLYRCVVMVSDLQGRVTQKEATFAAHDGQVSIESRAGTDGLTIVGAGENGPKITMLAHDEKNGAIVNTSGDLVFRFGKFFAGSDTEKMRLTAEGSLGIGTDKPQAPLDVNGLIRTSKGIMFPDGTVLTTAAGAQAATGTGAANRANPTTQPTVVGAGTLGQPFGSANHLTPRTNAVPAYQFLADSTGVHIGTTSAYGLDVTGHIRTDTAYYVGANQFASGGLNGSTSVGLFAGNLNGPDNSFFGTQAGLVNSTGGSNAFFGYQAGASNIAGSSNAYFGLFAGVFANADNNTMVGTSAGFNTNSGAANTAVGQGALYTNTTGGGNIAIGKDAGTNLTTGSNNIDIGHAGVAADGGTIRMGTPATHTRTFIAGIRGVPVGADAINVVIDSTGQLGTNGGSAYAYIYNMGAKVVAIEAPVAFDSNGPLLGVTHAPGNAGIVVTNSGTYDIAWTVSGVEPNQFALFVNGASAAGSIYGSGAATQQNNGQGILTLSASDVVTLVNHSSAAAVTLQTLAGGTQTNVNASVLIRKLN
jgi:hypothetical protein